MAGALKGMERFLVPLADLGRPVWEISQLGSPPRPLGISPTIGVLNVQKGLFSRSQPPTLRSISPGRMVFVRRICWVVLYAQPLLHRRLVQRDQGCPVQLLTLQPRGVQMCWNLRCGFRPEWCRNTVCMRLVGDPFRWIRGLAVVGYGCSIYSETMMLWLFGTALWMRGESICSSWIFAVE